VFLSCKNPGFENSTGIYSLCLRHPGNPFQGLDGNIVLQQGPDKPLEILPAHRRCAVIKSRHGFEHQETGLEASLQGHHPVFCVPLQIQLDLVVFAALNDFEGVCRQDNADRL
jgi:hypothetical protein